MLWGDKGHHMTDPAFEDVNEAVAAEWEADTTPFDRVRTVIRRTYEPQSAAEIAEAARTTPKTARKHLTSLVESGYVATQQGEGGATLYRRSPESLVTEQAREILASVSRRELAERVQGMRADLAEYRERLGVDSPEDLAVAQGTAALDPEAGLDRDDVDPELVREWQTTRRNLAFANAALAIATAQDVADEVPGAG